MTKKMGCLQSRERTESSEVLASPEKKIYSWDRADRPDPKELIVENLEGGKAVKLPGSLKGSSFVVQNCKSSHIYILDHTGAVNIDDCEDCDIVLGPVKGSVFIRDCKGCRCLIACQQFRMRDCHKLEVFLHCQSQPVTENATAIKFGCFQGGYDGLVDQFEATRLSPFMNQWAQVHDFTPVPDTDNWTLFPAEAPPTLSFLGTDEGDDPSSTANLSFERNLLPKTLGGIKQRPYGEEGRLVAFTGTVGTGAVLDFVLSVADKMLLVQTAEVSVTEEQAHCLFSGAAQSFLKEAVQGKVVLLEFSGVGCAELLQGALDRHPFPPHQSYLSPSTQQGLADIEAWDQLGGVPVFS